MRTDRTCPERGDDGAVSADPSRPQPGEVEDIGAVIFDLDGVLVDSEPLWDAARQEVVARHGGSWRPEATRDVMGMSSPEWGAYLHDRLGVQLPPPAVVDEVTTLLEREYRRRLPVLPGAPETVRTLASRWPLGMASSSGRSVIDLFLDASGLRSSFAASVSSDEVTHGKPAPDVYLEAARRLDTVADRCVAIEDSTNGILAAVAAGMAVIAVPNTHFPPDDDALGRADAVVGGLHEVSKALVSRVGSDHRRPR